MDLKSIQEASCLLRNADQALGAANVGITPVQLAVLAYVADSDEPVTLGMVAKNHQVTNAVVTGLVDRLEKSGAVKRVPSPNDRRRVYLEITDAGADLLFDAEQALKAVA
jgi:DNA-binding MarR family transcriptional regulator